MPHPPRRDAVTSRLRLRGYDYATPGAYFVTLCTERRVCLFGDVVDDEMRLSAAGQVIESWWGSIPLRFPSVALDAMVVKPNHIHGIVMIPATDALEIDSSTPSLSVVMHWFKTRTTYDYILGVRTEGWPRYPGKLWQLASTITSSAMSRRLSASGATSKQTRAAGRGMRRTRVA